MFLCFVVLLASNQIFTESRRDAARKEMHTEIFQQHAAARLFNSNLRLTATHGFPRTFGPKACSLQKRSLFCTTKTLERQVGRITNRLSIKCRCFISKVQKWETCNNACGTLRQSFGGTKICEDVSSGKRSIPTVKSQTDHQLVPGIMVFYIKKTMMIIL